MQLKLHTPKSEQVLLQAPEIHPTVTMEWLEKPSLSNPEEAAQTLLAELGRLNRTELDYDRRTKLPTLYEPVVQKLIEALITTLPENGTPQSTVHREAANLIYELALELSYAWKLAYRGVEQKRTLFGSAKFGSAKTRQHALTHLLDALSGQIRTSYRIYAPPSLRSWHELHQVYKAIRQESAPAKATAEPMPYETTYKRTLLLALADPFRFTRPEIEVALAYLEQFGHLARLSAKGKRGKSMFRINLDADAPSTQDTAPENSNQLVLDTHALCKHLRSLIIKLKAGESFRDIGLLDAPQRVNGQQLLSCLHQAWRGNLKRGFNRYEPEVSYVEVISGIPTIHRWLDSKQKAAPDSLPKANNAANGLADQGQLTRWRIVNDSACGLAISAHAQEVAQVRMGNLIALREENTESAGWTLAIIRWGKISKGQVIVSGVEKISPDASPVILRFLHDKATNIGQLALLIPANTALQTEERLLLPQGLYQRGHTADMWHKGERRRIGLGSLVAQTPFLDLAVVNPA